MCKKTLFQTLKTVLLLIILFLFLQFTIALIASSAIMFLVGALSAFMKVTHIDLFISSFESFTFLLSNFTFQIIALIYFFNMYKKRKLNIHNIKLKITPKLLGKYIVISFGIIGLLTLWVILVKSLASFIPFLQNNLTEIISAISYLKSDPILAFITLVILAPILEELFFRGIIFNELAKYKQGVFPIIISGLIFGLAHMQFIQIIFFCILGIILGFIYSRTYSLPMVVFIHMLINLISILPKPYLKITGILGLISIIPMVYFLIKMKQNRITQLIQ